MYEKELAAFEAETAVRPEKIIFSAPHVGSNWHQCGDGLPVEVWSEWQRLGVVEERGNAERVLSAHKETWREKSTGATYSRVSTSRSWYAKPGTLVDICAYCGTQNSTDDGKESYRQGFDCCCCGGN